MDKMLLVDNEYIKISWDDKQLNTIMNLLYAPWNSVSHHATYSISVISKKKDIL